jgi:hypothetical protein
MHTTWLTSFVGEYEIGGGLTGGVAGGGGDDSEEKWAPGRFSLARCRFVGGLGIEDTESRTTQTLQRRRRRRSGSTAARFMRASGKKVRWLDLAGLREEEQDREIGGAGDGL